jgi:GNAT superfamily N-acetyltransferase
VSDEVGVRRIRPGDAAALRNVRLRALQADPAAFASSHASEAARPDEAWKLWAAAASTGGDQTMYVADAGDHFVGLAGAYRREDQPRTLHLIALWVDPGFRRRGLGRLLSQAVIDWATRSDADRLELWMVDGNPGAALLYESLGFARTGRTQPLPSDPSLREELMSLPLGGLRRIPGGYVEFQPMDEGEMASYFEWSIASHTADLMHLLGAGIDEARRLAQDSVTEVMSDPNWRDRQHLCTMRAGLGDEVVGWIWFGEGIHDGERVALLRDIVVFEPRRGQGLGSSALDELEEWSRIRNLPAIALQVFTHNDGARRLYERLGYESGEGDEVATWMVKRLDR